MFSRNKNQNSSVSIDMMKKQKRYEALVKAFHADLFRYAMWLIKDKAIAEDVVQETFLRAWKSLDSLKDEAAAKSWLITILRRENARRFERKQFDLVDIDDVVVADVDEANAFGAVKLMGCPGEEIDPCRIQINRELPHRLHRITMKQRSVSFTHGGYLFERQ